MLRSLLRPIAITASHATSNNLSVVASSFFQFRQTRQFACMVYTPEERLNEVNDEKHKLEEENCTRGAIISKLAPYFWTLSPTLQDTRELEDRLNRQFVETQRQIDNNKENTLTLENNLQKIKAALKELKSTNPNADPTADRALNKKFGKS